MYKMQMSALQAATNAVPAPGVLTACRRRHDRCGNESQMAEARNSNEVASSNSAWVLHIPQMVLLCHHLIARMLTGAAGSSHRTR